MKHFLLDSELEIATLYKDGDRTFYDLRLTFTDLINRRRFHNYTFGLEDSITISPKISFTAISDISIQQGIVTSLSKQSISVIVPGQDTIKVNNLHEEELRPGDAVYVFDHLDTSSNKEQLTKYIIKVRKINLDDLRLQYINADVLDQNQNIALRMGVDSIYSRGCYVKTLES